MCGVKCISVQQKSGNGSNIKKLSKNIVKVIGDYEIVAYRERLSIISVGIYTARVPINGTDSSVVFISLTIN